MPASSFEVPRVPIAQFLNTLSDILPKLIEFVGSPAVRTHPVWSEVIPYQLQAYGEGVSRGHCVRPDILLTHSGPKVCELDFVPSGRGYLLAALDERRQQQLLQAFSKWYSDIGARRVLYATATKTISYEETSLFCALMRQKTETNITEGNLDEVAQDELQTRFIDRLSYRSEMNTGEDRKLLTECDVATAEPYLDSKAIFALIHDNSLLPLLEETFSKSGIAFLRNAFPETRLVRRIKSEKEMERFALERSNWTIKSTDVEADYSWGCRSTIVGARCSQGKFLATLQGTAIDGKEIGANPILQRWYQSRDFWQVWDATVEGRYKLTDLVRPDAEPDPKTFVPATKEVGARIGFYFLVDRARSTCTVTPYGTLVLRQDPLIHGARDALCLAVEAY